MVGAVAWARPEGPSCNEQIMHLTRIFGLQGIQHRGLSNNKKGFQAQLNPESQMVLSEIWLPYSGQGDEMFSMARVQVSPAPATCSEYGKGAVSQGISAYQEETAAGQVKATAHAVDGEACGFQWQMGPCPARAPGLRSVTKGLYGWGRLHGGNGLGGDLSSG